MTEITSKVSLKRVVFIAIFLFTFVFAALSGDSLTFGAWCLSALCVGVACFVCEVKESRKMYATASVFLLVSTMLCVVILSANTLYVMEAGLGAEGRSIDVLYQQKTELVPNLILATKNYMTFEESLLSNITALRSRIDDPLTKQQIDEIVNYIVVRMTSEAYPNLKADALVTMVMKKMIEIENALVNIRNEYNQHVRNYNIYVNNLPRSWLLRLFGLVKPEKTYPELPQPMIWTW